MQFRIQTIILLLTKVKIGQNNIWKSNLEIIVSYRVISPKTMKIWNLKAVRIQTIV